MDRPNIIYLHSHDTGRYIQPYGVAVPTPNLQRLADEGLLFRQCHCAGPTCSPSRASLLTGQSCHSSGMTGLAHLGFSLSDDRRHVVHTLRQAGYRSTLIGVQHVSRAPDEIGYDEVLPVAGKHVAEVAPAAEAFLRRDHDQPFFASIGFFETHRVFTETSAEDARYVRPPAPTPDTPETRADMAGFIESARRLDDGIGRVLAALDSSGLAENTLVIATTDHGVAFPYAKCNLTDHGTGVMLIMRGPGGFTGGKVLDGLVSQIDVFPTLCDWLGIDPPEWPEGRSMMPLVDGSAGEINEEIFSEVNYHVAYEPMRSVRTRRWKYIRRFHDYPGPVLCNCDASPSKEAWLAAGWRDRPQPAEQLFDLALDPNEADNRIADPSCVAAADQLRGRLEAWMRRTSDPLLSGSVPPPEGALVLHAGAEDPSELRRS